MKTRVKMRAFVVMAMSCTLLLISSCSKDEETVSPSISDENFYKMVGNALINCYVDIYNQNLAGVTTGEHNITTTGPLGGSVLITGTTSYDNTHHITGTDLVFSMTGVKYTYSFTDNNGKSWTTQITLSGNTTYSGTFSNTYTSVNHQSDLLLITGTVSHEGITRSMDDSGVVSINRSSIIVANIFGHTVSW
ncbi:MAG: hypothetical protein KQI35_08795 [Bacteroidetes bacterium]|nr:hypothetical protein [Bacteroidota bacterium]